LKTERWLPGWHSFGSCPKLCFDGATIASESQREIPSAPTAIAPVWVRQSAMSEANPASHKHHHRKSAVAEVSTAVVTVSDTRTLETDTGGARVAELLDKCGHPVVVREIVKDQPEAISATLGALLARDDVRAVVLTGGTGVAPRDVTPDAVEPLLDRVVPGFGELFRALSYEEIGSAALLSRALAGLASGRVVFVLPGSRGAVELAMQKLILPELGHLAAEAVKTR
jgi:molybdenum cofactor biosynthesis protein B